MGCMYVKSATEILAGNSYKYRSCGKLSMEGSPVTVVSASDVVCATTTAAASAVLALEIENDFLINMKREGKNLMEETNKRISGHIVSLDMNSTRIQSLLEKAAGKLCTKFSKAKGGAERKKIRGAKTRVTLQMSDIVNVVTVEAELEETAVCDNIK